MLEEKTDITNVFWVRRHIYIEIFKFLAVHQISLLR